MLAFKRIIAMVLMLSMLLANVCYGEIPADVKGTDFKEAAIRLGNLGIMVGDNAGFRPNDFIKRSEFAAIVVRVLGQEDVALGIGTENNFTDVPDTHWAKGYIGLAYSNGIINGMGDGTFSPDSLITYHQAVKMIMCALGYKPAADTLGGYPTGYLIAAQQEGVTDGAEGIGENAVSRGIVAKLVDNALDVPLMIRSGSAAKEKYIKSGTSGTSVETLMANRLKLNKYNAFITDVDVADKTITFKIGAEDRSSNLNSLSEVKKKVADGITLTGLKESYAVILTNKADTLVVSVQKDEEAEVIYDYIEAVNKDASPDHTYGAAFINNVTLKNTAKTYDIRNTTDGGAEIHYAGENTSNASQKYVNCFVKVVMNQSRIVYMDVYPLSEGGIITKVGSTFVNYVVGESGGSVRGLTDANYLQIIVDGKETSLSGLAPEMMMDFFKSTDGENIWIVASTKKLEGKFNGYSSEKIQVENQRYDLETVYAVYYSVDNGQEYKQEDRARDLIGTQIVAFIDAKGQVRYIKGSAGANESELEFYGVVNKGWIDEKSYLEVFKAVGDAGKLVTYPVENDSVYQTALANAKKKDGSGVYKFVLNHDGEIESIEAVSYLLANNAFNSRPAAVKHTDQYTFYSRQRLDESNLADSQIQNFDNDNRIKVRTILSYNATTGVPTFNSDQFVAVANAKIFSLVDEDGNFSPRLLSYEKDIKGKYVKDVDLKFENNVDDCKVVVLVNNILNLRSDSKKYGFIQEISKTSKSYYSVKIFTSDNTEKTYTIHQSNLKDVDGYYPYGTQPKTAGEKNFVIFVEGGSSVIDDEGQEQVVSTNGMAKILKSYDLTQPWAQADHYASKTQNLNAGYIDHAYKVDASGLYEAYTDGNGNKKGKVVLANSYADNVIDSKDSAASIDSKVIIFEANEGLDEFTLSTMDSINTVEGKQAGDKVFYIAQQNRIRILVYLPQ